MAISRILKHTTSQANKQGLFVKFHDPNYKLLIIIGCLLVFGLVVLSSASSVKGFYNPKIGDSFYYVKHQLLYGVLFGLISFFVFAKIDYHFWKKYAFPMVLVTVSFLFLVPIIGTETYGAKRWLDIGFFQFQPSELVKLTFLIYLAVWLENRAKKLDDFAYGFLPFIAMLVFLVLMIAGLQKDLGTMIVIAVILVTIYFVAGAPLKHLSLIGLGSIATVALMIKLFPYRMDRLTVFLNPEMDPQNLGYQVSRAVLAIGSGGFFGLGLGHSIQKYSIPEPASDSIFAILGEELGFVFTVALVLLFVFFFLEGIKIAKTAPDPYGKIIAAGITVWISFQAIVNICAMLSLVPLTGIPLPFISYGSTALVMNLTACGILMNISKQTKKTT